MVETKAGRPGAFDTETTLAPRGKVGAAGGYGTTYRREGIRAMIKRVVFAMLVLMLMTGTRIRADTDTVLLSGLYNVYSPATPKGALTTMWLGGWLVIGDVPDDRIYRSVRLSGVWQTPVQNLHVTGGQINDPTLVKPPSTDGINRSTWTYLYTTGPVTGVFEGAPVGNIEMWVSTDGGLNWADVATVIGPQAITPAGEVAQGCISPSVVKDGDTLWIYCANAFTGGGGWVFNTNANGWQVNWSAPLLGPGGLTNFVNFDVWRTGATEWYMATNCTDLHTICIWSGINNQVFNIAEATFTDPAEWMLTPYLLKVSNTQFKVWYGKSVAGGLWGSVAPSGQEIRERVINR